MNKNTYNPYENMLAVLDEAASRLGLKEADYITLRYPEREMIVSIPVRMDNGEMKVFEGYSTTVPEALIRGESASIRTRIWMR